MGIYTNGNLGDIYVGEDKIDSIFLGEDQVYSSGPKALPLYFEPVDPNSVATVNFYQYLGGDEPSKLPSYTIPTLEYSYDNITWSNYVLNTDISIGGSYPKRVYFRGDNPNKWYAAYSNPSTNKSTLTSLQCKATGQIISGGRISSLRSKDLNIINFNIDGCYYYLFYGCTSLTTVPELPATTLAKEYYYGMFTRCTSLTTAPELPATTLADNCYGSMFNNCTSLTTPPELPATTLAKECYATMFYKCSSLTTPPELPATTLASGCYLMMFSGCTSLQQIPKLSALTIPDGGILGTYGLMFDKAVKANASSSGVCKYPYRIPTSGTGTSASKALDNMFSNLNGSDNFTPSINTTFYISVPSF